MSEFQSTRNSLLQRCEAVLKADNFISSSLKQAWVTYRNALQDMDTSVENPVFPVAPDEPIFPLTAGQVTERSELAGYLQTISTQYQIAIDRLIEIETAGTIPFTQAGFNQVVAAVKDEAKNIRLIAQALKKLLT